MSRAGLPSVLLVALGLAAAAASASAHVRLVHPTNGNPLRWSSPGSIGVVIQAEGSDDIPDGAHIPAFQLAIRAWNDAVGTTATLVEDASPASRARTDWESSSIHLLLFDETNDSGFFPGGSGIVALTPVWFFSNGVISDADVLFNGVDFEFTTSGEPGAFDVQDVAAHELGHLLGLDHSGWAGATMYPYVDPAVILHRSIADDDERGLRDAYPTGTYSTITGRVVRDSDDTPVAGANVVARGADGRCIAGALSDADGEYALRGLEAGAYTLWASPLDQPVSAANLSDFHTVETDFQSTEIASATVDGSTAEDVGDGSAGVGDDAAFSLGRNIDEFPIRVVPGAPSIHSLHGTGLVAGSTLAASDPDFTITVLAWNTTVVTFQVEAPANEPDGHVDLVATNLGGDVSVLHAALEVAPVEPFVLSAAPATGTIAGGTPITITGADFRAGARVILANEVYVDGDAGGCTVVNDTTITLVTRAAEAGAWDVVVQDRSGVEGRAGGAYTYAALPQIQVVFPPAGFAGGGTLVRVRGSDFVPGMTVTIDGDLQSGVDVLDDETLEFTTAAGVPGGPYVLEVETPLGDSASAAFTFQGDPDPLITSVTPAYGATAGGDVVTIVGANFTVDAEVVFGADPLTGQGGTAAIVAYVDAGTLEVTTPAMAAGAASVLVRLALTDQAAVAGAAYTYESPASGGGGCSIVPVAGPRTPLDGFAAFLPVLLALAWLAVQARRTAPARSRVRA